jgi:predicted O-methyltransferase YrrM
VALPKTVRLLTPDRVRDHPSVRAVALTCGLIPPRTMHSEAEAQVLARLAAGAGRVVEIGVYEGSSAIRLARAMPAGAELHLIDPFTDESGAAMRPGWHGNAVASRVAVRRHTRNTRVRVRWHLARSQDVGRRWDGGSVDFVFVDGDHSEDGVRDDWEAWNRHIRPGGNVAFHDARDGQPDGVGSPGPTAVVDRLFREHPPAGWRIVDEKDSLVVVQRA